MLKDSDPDDPRIRIAAGRGVDRDVTAALQEQVYAIRLLDCSVKHQNLAARRVARRLHRYRRPRSEHLMMFRQVLGSAETHGTAGWFRKTTCTWSLAEPKMTSSAAGMAASAG